jgi:outer membrane cobalamin receptor
MAADDIESIEVINNPGAQFGNEAGGGPILNLVMRRNRKPGGFTTVNGNAGTAGRYNSAVNSTYNEGAWGRAAPTCATTAAIRWPTSPATATTPAAARSCPAASNRSATA